MKNEENILEDNKGGGGRMLIILLVTTAIVAILYLFFGRTSKFEEDITESSNCYNSTLLNESLPRFQILEKFKTQYTTYLYIKDLNNKICFVADRQMQLLFSVPCDKADPNLREK